jgi:DNA-binding NarL/FixJ family response regulator
MIENEEKIKVIIVDDSYDFIQGLLFYLEKELNYSVIGIASNGKELLEHPLLQEAEILLIDCEMPIMNGIETAINITKLYPHMLMIATTLYDENVYIEELLHVGFKGYVNKADINKKLKIVMDYILNQKKLN